jgi:serine/threonine protein kinase
MAPEVLREDDGYDPFVVDVWGLGMILYVLIHGTSPNASVRQLPVLEEIMATTTKFSHSAGPLTTPLLDGMLCFDPEARWSLEKAQEYISTVLPN